MVESTGGALSMAQLEYNLPILVFGSSPSMSTTQQTMNATVSKASQGLSIVSLALKIILTL